MKTLTFVAVLAFASAAWSHPDHEEPGLLSHWAVGHLDPDTGAPGGLVEDVTHSLKAKLMGAPAIETVGPTLAAIFNGKSDYLVIHQDIAKDRKGLPTKEFSVAAWVSVRETQQWGSIMGCVQDDGGTEKGWVLGFNDQTFTFGLSTVGGSDGDGKLTFLPAKTPIVPGKWYYVVGTYDGTTMRLYVNGVQEGESKDQSGDILYPPSGPYTIACFKDANEEYPLAGALHRVKAYSRVLTPKEITDVTQKNSNLVAYVPPEDAEVRWLVKPYLQAATLSSMVVMSETNRASTMTVEYGRRQPLQYKAEMTTPAMIGEVKLSDLEPATDYFYRVTRTTEDGKTISSDVKAMKTAIPADMPWSFGIIGDTQRNPSVTQACAEVMYKSRPNFVLHCGDVVDDGYSKNQWLKDLFEPMSGLLAHAPIYPTIGNHERNSHFYYDYFSLPTPEYYYTFTFGNAEFFMIDTNKPCGPDSEQWKWLERDLAKSTATWKFTCHHHPCFTSDEDDYGDTITGKKNPPDIAEPSFRGDRNARQLVELYEKYGVDIAFNGHIHVYERTWPILDMKINQAKGIRYITSGGGGGGLEHPAPNKAWFSLQVNREHHVCYVAIHDRTIVFKAIDTSGRMFDAFELTKPSDR
ncbi:MAG: LamG-like jellyroll fold domain-containing protein [Planctomycetota bacterium]|nr:LamG-like jellyroll fold domain-containing protein [Planctomycetota bacterium]